MYAKSKSDIFYRRFILSRLFANGWGDLNAFKRLLELRDLLGNRSSCYQLVSDRHPVQLERSWSQESHIFVAQGHFTSPVVTRVPDLLPRESEQANFQIVVPKQWHSKDRKPLCIHLAGTGDHFFWRRRNLMAKPLAKESGIASVILESPYYGLRKPKGQTRSSLRHVLDLFIMGASLVLEALALLHWCERQGFGPLCLSGVSMGGHMASLAATAWPKPLAVVPCLSWSTASCVFTQGVMKHSCVWSKLDEQLSDQSYSEELVNLLSPDGSSEFMFQHTENVRQHYSDAGLCTVPIKDAGDLSQSCNYYQKQENDQIDASRSLYLDKEHLIHGLKGGHVLQNIPNILRTAMGQFGSPSIQAVNCMDYVMDKVTHLDNFTRPVDPSLAKFVVAKHDAYVPRDKVADMRDIWPGCEVEFIDSGHVSGSLIYQDTFRKAIVQILNRL